jgi:hypothetical protein
MPDRSGWIAKSRVTIWRWNDFESIALQVKPQIETHFELHWVPEITHSVRLAVPNEKIQFTGGSHWREGLCILSISILFNPKSHASTDKDPGPTNASPAPIEARRIAGQRVSWNTRISLTDSPTDRIPATGAHNPAVSTAPTATSSKPRVSGKSGSL